MHVATPDRLPEADLPLSDDVPSSPTPSSTKDADVSRIPSGNDDVIEDEELEDPPSSPPRKDEEWHHANDDSVLPLAADEDGEQVVAEPTSGEATDIMIKIIWTQADGHVVMSILHRDVTPMPYRNCHDRTFANQLH